ncbi:MAG: hypothetical protein Q8O64_10865 [Sideroxyarcus sp.]|nr:hypothetical protein [Sideroxyarcus sp.]
MSASEQLSFEPVDNGRLANLCGAFDQNLRQIGAALVQKIVSDYKRFNYKNHD